MGNRATVIFHDDRTGALSPAVHLHVNGGPESVYAFLDELDRRKVRADADYEAARFVHVAADFFDQDAAGGHSLGVRNGPARIDVDDLEAFDPGDNGVYVVCRTAAPRRVRRFNRGREWTPCEVERERRKAYRHPYITDRDGVPAQLARLRPAVNPNG